MGVYVSRLKFDTNHDIYAICPSTLTKFFVRLYPDKIYLIRSFRRDSTITNFCFFTPWSVCFNILTPNLVVSVSSIVYTTESPSLSNRTGSLPVGPPSVYYGNSMFPYCPSTSSLSVEIITLLFFGSNLLYHI